jgi:transketolase
LENQAINTIRFLAIDAVQKANSGHPGLPMGAAPMAYVLWTKFLRHNPQNPDWFNRDRFVLSAGHGSMLVYALLHLTGYDLSLDELKNFRQWDSKTPGHPEHGETPGIETTTGPLGQGISTAVGFAMAEAFLATKYNRDGHNIVDHYTYVIASDGDLMEGVAAEACSLAGHLQLGKLIVLYDDNNVTLDTDTDAIFTEDVSMRFRAYGWHTLTVEDGNDTAAIEAALKDAQRVTDKPTLINIRTVIGYGSPNKAGTSKAHGSPLGENEVTATKENLGWPLEPTFHIPDEASQLFRTATQTGPAFEGEWNAAFAAYEEAHPELAAELQQALKGELPTGWDSDIPTFEPGETMATRNASGKVLNAIARHIPTFIGGDADLAGSTKTLIDGEGNFGPTEGYDQRNLRFGVREHAMGAIASGLALHGGIVKPYTATFLTFSDYMRPVMRLAAQMHIAPLYIFTHDSIGLGEDGPTHQPIEHVSSLRTIPGVTVFRPADANESAGAWRAAMQITDGPSILIFTRQKLRVLDPAGVGDNVAKGAYVLSEADGEPQAILMATGSEVEIALDAQQRLADEGIHARVVSMPSWELFEAQDQSYRDEVLPPHITTRVAIEAGVEHGWHKWIGPNGRFIGLDRYGASAPYKVIYEQLGITSQAAVDAVKAQL